MYSFDTGFRDAWSSIWASNVSSLITGVVLYGFGSSIVRGFALTFSIGIILSMFTAIIITKTMLRTTLALKATHKPWLLGSKKISV